MKTYLLKVTTVVLVYTGLFLNATDVVAQHQFRRESVEKDIYTERLQSISKRFKNKGQLKKAEAHKIALSKGWEITKKLPNGGFMELEQLGPDGAPIYFTTLNDNVVSTSRSNALYQNGDLHLDVNGLGMYVGVWDSGHALMTHQELEGRVQNGDDSRRTSGHATHVLGTIMASGVDSEAKGVAYNAEGVTFDWSNDEAEVAEAAANGMLLSNHSYGISGKTIPDWYFGAYIYQAKDWDEIMHNAPYYLMVTAAGNTQQYQYNEQPNVGTPAEAHDLLLGYAVAKNGLTVAAADNVVLDDKQNLVSADIAPFSNFGPTDDGRIKPDITGAGVNVYSAYSDNDASYVAQSGTSMAAPGVTGALLLLQQYYKETHGHFMKASTLKGLALHTADEAGDYPGPDYKFGWGVINTKKAAEAISKAGFESDIKEGSLTNGETFTYTVNAEEGKTLMASISWTDPASVEENKGNINDSTPVLVNDLDIIIQKEGEETPYYPWKLSISTANNGAQKGVNNIDPFEKIEIPNASGTYTIIVNHKGNLATSAQDFSLVITGMKGSDCELKTPEGLIVAAVKEETANLEWEPVVDAIYEIAYRAKTAGKSAVNEWSTTLATENKLSLNKLSQNTVYEWKVRTLCSELATSDYSTVNNFKTKFIDVEAPQTPSNITVSAVQQHSLSVHWDGATDNVKTVAYGVFMDGIKIGETSENTLRIDQLQANTTYEFEIVALDAAGNASEKSNPYPVTTLTEESLADVIAFNDFEAGIGNWSAAGIWGASKGKYAINGSIAASSRETGQAYIQTPKMNIMAYEKLTVDFYLLTTAKSNTDMINVSINNGYGWKELESYVINQDVDNGYFYQATLSISNAEIKFTEDTQIRIETLIQSELTSVYIDDVTVKGYTNSADKKSVLNRLAAMEQSELLETEDNITRINVYPNPTVSNIKINGLTKTNDAYQIFNASGSLIASGNGYNKMIDVSNYPPGLYVVAVQQDGKMTGTKFMKN